MDGADVDPVEARKRAPQSGLDDSIHDLGFLTAASPREIVNAGDLVVEVRHRHTQIATVEQPPPTVYAISSTITKSVAFPAGTADGSSSSSFRLSQPLPRPAPSSS